MDGGNHNTCGGDDNAVYFYNTYNTSETLNTLNLSNVIKEIQIQFVLYEK